MVCYVYWVNLVTYLSYLFHVRTNDLNEPELCNKTEEVFLLQYYEALWLTKYNILFI